MGIDMSTCSAITYRYKGSAHTFKVQDGLVTDYAYHAYEAQDSENWTTMVIKVDEIEQPNWTQDPKDLNWTNIKKMAWEVIGYKNIKYQPKLDYLYVDDLKCVGGKTGIRMAQKPMELLKLNVNGSMLNVTTTAAARIQVFDMMGNLVMNRVENSAGNHQVSLEGMNRGNYVVRVKTAGAAQTARISLK